MNRAERHIFAAFLGVIIVLTACAPERLLALLPSLRCPFLAATEFPCPLCGMTRSVLHAFHGDLWMSLRLHPAGALFSLAMVLAVPVLISDPLYRAAHAVFGNRKLTGLLMFAAIFFLAAFGAARIIVRL